MAYNYQCSESTNIFGKTGSNTCLKCHGKECCVKLEPPTLTGTDIAIMKQHLHLREKDFVMETEDSSKDKFYYVLPDEFGRCIFFDEQKETCKIFLFRPMDCQLFPLDIIFENGKYYWILYKFCKLSDKVSEKVLKKADRLVSNLLDEEIRSYIGSDASIFDLGNWVRLRAVNIKG